jgi:FixJ family two-component response regulator
VAIQQFDFASGKVVTTDRRQAMILVKDTEVQDQLQAMLRENLYKVPIKSADVKEVLEVVRTQKTGVLFLDDEIEGVSAISLLVSVRSKFPDVAIIVLSASPTKELSEAMLKTGVESLIKKPIARDLIYKALARIK